MKIMALMALALGLSACAAQPEVMLQSAQRTCNLIGYNIETERVPTLQCTERQYNREEDKNANKAWPLMSIGIGVATVAASGAL